MQKPSKGSGAPVTVELLITADDRTGALEAGGACADLGFDVRLASGGTPARRAMVTIRHRNLTRVRALSGVKRSSVASPNYLDRSTGLAEPARCGQLEDVPPSNQVPHARESALFKPSRAPDSTDDCAVVDLDSRHCSAGEAARRIGEAHRTAAAFRCHKMDSGLRGNWPYEVAALIGLGRPVGILASFPDAGRRCDDGTVYIRDVPVAESPFGRDPRSRLLSSRPVDFLRAAGCGSALADGRLVVLDANTNEELTAAAVRCRREGRMLVGTTGGVGAYVATLRSGRATDLPALPRPALIVCGSLHPLSRMQVSKLACLTVGPDDSAEHALATLQRGEDVILATEMTTAEITDIAAESMASVVAAIAWDWLAASGAPTVIILGGDTAAAILGDRTLRVLGSADTAVPLCQTEEGLAVVTKGGGIGEEDTLSRLLRRGTA